MRILTRRMQERRAISFEILLSLAHEVIGQRHERIPDPAARLRGDMTPPIGAAAAFDTGVWRQNQLIFQGCFEPGDLVRHMQR